MRENKIRENNGLNENKYLKLFLRAKHAESTQVRGSGFPGGSVGNESCLQWRRCRRHVFIPWVGKIPWWRAWEPTPVFLHGESHGQRSLAGYSP